jgi:prevent-host-death family protein
VREVRLHDARADLSAIVDDAIDSKPVVIMRRGKKQAVVLGSEYGNSA